MLALSWGHGGVLNFCRPFIIIFIYFRWIFFSDFRIIMTDMKKGGVIKHEKEFKIFRNEIS